MGELDPQLDERNVYINPVFWCGVCNKEMSKIGIAAYKCGKCKQAWLEN